MRTSLLAPDINFLIGVFLMGFGVAIVEVFDIETYEVTFAHRISGGAFIKSIELYVITCCSFSIGYCFSSIFVRKKAIFLYHNGRVDQKIISKSAVILMFLFSCLASCFYLYFYGQSSVIGTYSGVVGRGGLENAIFYFMLISNTVTLCMVLEKAVSRSGNIDIIEYGVLLFVLFIAGVMLMSGDRGEFVYIALPLGMYMANRFSSTIRNIGLALILFAGLFVFAAIREYRSVEDSGFGFLISIVANLPMKEALSIALTNVGQSGLLLGGGIDFVASEGYFLGAFFLNALLSIFPGVRGLLTTIGYGSGGYLESANLLTDLLLPEGATGGVGTNTVVDSYLDFGIIGVVCMHLALGALAGYVQGMKYLSSSWIVRTIYFVSLGTFLLLPRYAPISFLIRYLLYPYLLLLVVSKITSIVAWSFRERNG